LEIQDKKFGGYLDLLGSSEVIHECNAREVGTYLLHLNSWANELGFPNDRNTIKALEIVDGIGVEEICSRKFGKNGKPYYIPGPRDDAKKIAKIVDQLNSSCGPGNFDFVEIF
jgi:hypothetical protein